MREFTVPAAAPTPQVGGLADVVFDHAAEDPDRPALSRKDAAGEWQDVTAADFRDQVMAMAKGLLAEGIRFGDRVAIMSRTRYEWTLLDFSLWTIGAHVVPIYPTSSAEQVHWMMQDSQVSAAIVEHEDHAMTVGSVIDRLPQLKRLWQLDAQAEQELLAAGAHVEDDVVHRHRLAVTPNSTATIIYTSGTTGRPKGCVLTHANFFADADAISSRYQHVFSSKPSEPASLLLFLPLAHVLGRIVQLVCIRAKAKLGHQPVMSAEALLPDMASFRPTFMLAVPYLFEKIFQASRRKAELEGRLDPFEKAVDVAVRYAEAVENKAFHTGPGPSPSLRLQHQVFDALVYSKLRKALGGHCRGAVSAGSAMERRLGLFYDGVGMRIYEGYGLTETTAGATINPPERTRFGTVGHPIPGTTVRIAEDGEVWVYGDQVFQGYLNDPAGTDEILRGGWLATGDLGSLDEDGYLTITGRKKDILVTSGGKSLSPGVLEERVRAHPLIAQCIVVGNDRPYVSALITLDPDAITHWLQMRDKPELQPTELVRDPDLETEVRRAVVAANTQVSQAESIRTFRILAAQFTEKAGYVTPSLKLKRKAIETAYAAEIEALYHR